MIMSSKSKRLVDAAASASAASLGLLNLLDLEIPGLLSAEAEEVLGALLEALKNTLEIAGLDPDETERLALYCSVCAYLGVEVRFGG